LRHGSLVRICLENFPGFNQDNVDESPVTKQLTPLVLNLHGNESGPVFLILGMITYQKFLAWACVQIWSDDANLNFFLGLAIQPDVKNGNEKQKVNVVGKRFKNWNIF